SHSLGLLRVPNVQVRPLAELWKSLPHLPGDTQLRSASCTPDAGLTPRQLLDRVTASGTQVAMSCLAGHEDGSFELALLAPSDFGRDIRWPRPRRPMMMVTEPAFRRGRLRTSGEFTDEVRSWLAKELPGWMIPAAIHEIHEIPRLPNGKV